MYRGNVLASRCAGISIISTDLSLVLLYRIFPSLSDGQVRSSRFDVKQLQDMLLRAHSLAGKWQLLKNCAKAATTLSGRKREVASILSGGYLAVRGLVQSLIG
jgi:hypothetical protein